MAYPSLIHQLESELRDQINFTDLKATLTQQPARFNKLASALDLLGDTEMALEAFLGVHPDIEVEDSKGDEYLTVYGALQAMFLQQDAFAHIHEALGVPFELDATLQEVRDIRNDSIGHPSNRRDGQSFHFIVQVSLSRRGFQLVSFGLDDEPQYRHVDLWDLALRQNSSVVASLKELLKRLRSPSPPQQCERPG